MNISMKARRRNSPPVTKVPGLTSLQAMFQEFQEFHILQLPHPSTSREVGASSLKLMASKAFTSGLAESDSTSGDESNGNTESEELEGEDEPNTWTVVDRLKINSKLQEVASCRFCGDGARLRLQNFPRILLRAVRGIRTLCFIGRRHDPVDSRSDEA